MELQEHANLMAAVQIKKYGRKKPFSLGWIEKRFGQVIKYIASLWKVNQTFPIIF